MKQRIISITETDRRSPKDKSLLLEVMVPGQMSTSSDVRRRGNLTRGLQTLLKAGTGGWLEYKNKGNETVLQFYVNGKLHRHAIGSITPTAMEFIGSPNGVGSYYIGTPKGIYEISVSDKKPVLKFISVGSGDGHPHIETLSVENGGVRWKDTDGNTELINHKISV